jgi:alpha-methylacyl-CoA racemase
MTDGSALLMNAVFGIMQTGQWRERGTNLLDTGSHFYNTYETADGKYVSVGSIEPQFYALLLEKSGLGAKPDLPKQMARAQWPQLTAQLAQIFRQKTRDEWDEIMLGTDICYAPVLDFEEAQANEHNAARQTFVDVDGVKQAAPAPRFDRTPPRVPATAAIPGAQTDQILKAAGFADGEIAVLRKTGAVA